MTHFPITFAVNSTARPGAGHSAEEVTEMVSYLIAIVIVFVSPLAVPVATTVFYARDWRRRAVDARAERSPAVGAVRPALRAARTSVVTAEA
jgi:uncharacterized membrane protein